MKGKVSIIIPVYNAELYLERCLKSIINQTYKNFEIVIVDDGSTDNSAKIYNKFKKEANCIILKQKNGGPSAARNNGLSMATGKYIFFIDSDDYLEDNCLELLVNNTSKKNILVGLKHYIAYEDTKKMVEYQNEYLTYDYQKDIFDNKVNGVVWGFLFQRDIIEKNKISFDSKTSLSEDTIFLLEYLKNIDKIKFVNTYYNYFQASGSITNSINKDKIIRNINSSFYSIKKIDDILENKFTLSLIKTQMRLLKYEINKISDYSALCEIFNNCDVVNNIASLSNKKVGIFNKVYLLLLLNCKRVFFLILIMRKNLKRILKG